jgi:hypothetical protein
MVNALIFCDIFRLNAFLWRVLVLFVLLMPNIIINKLLIKYGVLEKCETFVTMVTFFEFEEKNLILECESRKMNLRMHVAIANMG